LEARQKWGAIYGQGVGLQGRSYAIPTKDHTIKALPLEEIKKHVCVFRAFAAEHPELTFLLTPIGCGLIRYSPSDIAPMFANAPQNVILPPEFSNVLTEQYAPIDTTLTKAKAP